MSLFTVKLSTDPEHCPKLLFKELNYQAQKTKDPPSLSKTITRGKPLLTNSLKHQLSLATIQYSERKYKQRKLESAQSADSAHALEGINFNN